MLGHLMKITIAPNKRKSDGTVTRDAYAELRFQFDLSLKEQRNNARKVAELIDGETVSATISYDGYVASIDCATFKKVTFQAGRVNEDGEVIEPPKAAILLSVSMVEEPNQKQVADLLCLMDGDSLGVMIVEPFQKRIELDTQEPIRA